MRHIFVPLGIDFVLGLRPLAAANLPRPRRLTFGPKRSEPELLPFDLVFPDPDGSSFNPENVGKRFDRLVQKLDLPRIRFYDLRHTYATHARRSGMDNKVLSDRLGHASITTTINLYQHVLADMAQEAAQSVADFILGQHQ